MFDFTIADRLIVIAIGSVLAMLFLLIFKIPMHPVAIILGNIIYQAFDWLIYQVRTRDSINVIKKKINSYK